ncbi:MAG: hypothetical protein AB8V25_02680 [Candidatus Midichloria sp.]
MERRNRKSKKALGTYAFLAQYKQNQIQLDGGMYYQEQLALLLLGSMI